MMIMIIGIAGIIFLIIRAMVSFGKNKGSGQVVCILRRLSKQEGRNTKTYFLSFSGIAEDQAQAALQILSRKEVLN